MDRKADLYNVNEHDFTSSFCDAKKCQRHGVLNLFPFKVLQLIGISLADVYIIDIR